MLVPVELRDVRGVEMDEAFTEAGARIIREVRRTPEGVELLVEHSGAPDHMRGRLVQPVWYESSSSDGYPLVLDRWELVTR